ncbi:hypothetical protein MKW98_001640 [Papaver atlanticum]|uniref:F-box associated beta-propeller type 1 domain-containing protein n=1 Tax=Papaver atlanticum TaxID=357466 RepID=A0AAD4X9Y4_9MAGN|nr:hypothetical protein MKW98_001640 [Papaver atlanticum]
MYNDITREIGLWNPSTRRCRLIPKSLDVKPKDWFQYRDFVGLCFDVETEDYKVIQVSSFEPRPLTGVNYLRKVQIYCLSTDCWRLIDSDFHIHCCAPEAGLGQSLNGIYFHQGEDYTAGPVIKPVILSFDLRKEKYQRVLQYPEQNTDNRLVTQLESIDDKLACITFNHTDFSSRIFKVWMLNNYNTTKELWTELYKIDFMSPEIQTRDGCYYGGILAISRNGKFGLLDYKSSMCYNSITDQINLCTVKATIYKESLVSIDAASKSISS